MKIAIRSDASSVIGTGHVMRCLTLASALRERGVVVSFVSREHHGHFCDLIAQHGFVVSRLPAPAPEFKAEEDPCHAAWLGVRWQDDAEQTRAAIAAMGGKSDWLVVDHYALDSRWEGALRSSVGRIMVIDDLADRQHDCDLLLDQNLVAEMNSRYVNKVPAACSMLFGPQYALLQSIYANLHDRIPPREGQIRRILISFGGADSDNLTGRAIAAFLQLNRPDIEADVIVAETSLHVAGIRQQVAGHGKVHLHSSLPTLAPLMAKADLAIGAAGATSWERLCMGLPTLVVTLAENQRPLAEELSQRGLIRWLGHQGAVSESVIGQTLEKLLKEDLDQSWSLRCLALVDGNGVKRVCAAMTVAANTALRVRHADLEDEALLLEWANDPTTRRSGFSPEPISGTTHRIWFQKQLRNWDGCRLYIFETTDDVPLGQVRFERSEQAWEVHYALAPAFRGRGLGRRLLEAALQALHADIGEARVLGRVKDNNRRSCRLFESLGFDIQPDATRGISVYWRTL